MSCITEGVPPSSVAPPHDSLLQPCSHPRGISTAIKYGMHSDELFIKAVVDGEREALGEASVIGEHDLMNSCVDEKRIDV